MMWLNLKRFSTQGDMGHLLRVQPKHAHTTASMIRLEHRKDLVPVGGAHKRTFDVVAAGTILLLIAPLMLGLAALVAMTSRGGVLFGHTRVGYDGLPFKCLKFRTMAADSNEVLVNHLERDPAARIEWDQTMKLRNDPRVTPVGQVLRKLSLDELPQLFNVLKGEMSLVGPRPVQSDELSRYGSSSRFYTRARPGITGLWQVSGRNTTSYSQRVAYDRLYVTRHSHAFDTMLLAKTLPAVMRSDETS